MKQLFIAVLTLIMGLPVCDDACLAANVSKNPARSPEYVIMWNEIYYTTSDSSIVEIINPDAFDATIISNTYEDGQGIITFDNNVTLIGDCAFIETNLTSIKIPYSVTTLGQEAFAECYSLTSINIPSNVTSIAETAFYGCRNLTDISVNQNNSTYDSRDNCNAIIETASNTLIYGCQNTIIPLSVTSIGENAFGNNPCLTSINIPSSVTSIGGDAFYGCSGLTSIDIPSSVTSIGQYAFTGCDGLTSITVEAGNSHYDSRDNCNAIIETESNTLMQGCRNTIVPNGVTSIGSWAFYNCDRLTSITLPAGLTSIGQLAFYGCDNLASVTLNNGLTSIGDKAFAYCENLTNINIPNSVTTIGGSCFSHCSKLASITISNNVKSIEGYTFDACTSLKNVTLPENLWLLGGSAFDNCNELTHITLPGTTEHIGPHAICSTKLTNITNLATTPQYLYSDSFAVQDTLHVLPGCGDAYRAADVWKDFKVILEDAESNTSLNAVHDSESAGRVFSVEGLPAGSLNKSGLYIQDRKKFLVR